MTYNLIDEIEDAVITPDRIRWIGSMDGKNTMTWKQFKAQFGGIKHDPEDPTTELAAAWLLRCLMTLGMSETYLQTVLGCTEGCLLSNAGTRLLTTYQKATAQLALGPGVP